MQRKAVQRFSTRFFALWLLLTCLVTLPVRATVLLELGFEELVAQSGFIFVGTAIDHRTAAQGEQLYTFVSFNVEEVVKGAAPADTVELRFLGGDAEDAGLKVEGQFIPDAGMRGVFFVTGLDELQVNPLTGWQQGYFPLVADDSGVDYLDMRQRPDLAIPGLEVEPLVSKMLGMGFSTEAIDAKFPKAFLFSLDDFRAAIVDEASRGAAP
ncbi:MAG: hypothetical protein V4603_05320 [Pseudomonadota bacterium]